LESHWSDWFDDLVVMTLDTGETLPVGTVVDQAALFGLLRKVRDLGLPLVSVQRVSSGDAAAPAADDDR
jgi:hypothetical protein